MQQVQETPRLKKDTFATMLQVSVRSIEVVVALYQNLTNTVDNIPGGIDGWQLIKMLNFGCGIATTAVPRILRDVEQPISGN